MFETVRFTAPRLSGSRKYIVSGDAGLVRHEIKTIAKASFDQWMIFELL